MKNNLKYSDVEGYVSNEARAELLSNIDVDEELGGYVLISSMKGEEQISGGHVYDIGQNLVTEREGDYKKDLIFLDEHDGKYLAVGEPSVVKWGNEGYAYNPYLFLITDDGMQRLLTTPSPENKDFNFRARLPRWSEDGNRFAYSVLSWISSDTPPDLLNLDDWNIFISTIDAVAEPRNVSVGYGAQWAGDHIIYLKSDGVYTRKVVKDAVLLSIGEEIKLSEDNNYYYRSNQNIGISDSGQYLVLPKHEGVYNETGVFEIYKLDFSDELNPAMLLVQVMPLEKGQSAFWPVFSPGGRYISMQVRGDENNSYSVRNKISIFDIVSNDFIQEVTLENYNFDFTFNTAWKKNFLLGTLE